MVEVVAEIGLNHGGDLDVAKAIVDNAIECGADTVKTQTAVPELETTAAAGMAAYQRGWTAQIDMIRELTLSFPDTLALARHCEVRGIPFLSTPADPVSLRFLVEECGVKRIKIGSDNLANPQLLQAVWATQLPLILSTGMATMAEIGRAMPLVRSFGTEDVTLMQCTSCYPCALADANVAAVRTLRETFGVPVGFSDHTLGMAAACAAVGAGAVIIEKHFTLDDKQHGPDHRMSLDPADMAAFVRAVRLAERAMGTGVKAPTRDELANAATVRKSLVAARQIMAGELFTPDSLAIKRPGTGRSPWDYFVLLGKPAVRAYAADEMIE